MSVPGNPHPEFAAITVTVLPSSDLGRRHPAIDDELALARPPADHHDLTQRKATTMTTIRQSGQRPATAARCGW